MAAKRKKGPNAVEKAAARSTRQALAEERLALSAIAKVMLLECPDPRRVLARIDAMARAAESDRRVPPTTVRAILDAQTFLLRAVRREEAKPKPLFDPARPEPSDERVDALVDATEGPQQLGLDAGGQESMLGDVEAAHAERVETISKVHDAIVGMVREHGGPMTDHELVAAYLRRYTLEHDVPQQSPKAVRERRAELSAAGRLVAVGIDGSGKTRYDVVERELINGEAA